MGWDVAVQRKKYGAVYRAVIQEENQIAGGEPQERGLHGSLDQQMVRARVAPSRPSVGSCTW